MRLVNLLQASAFTRDTLRRITIQFAEHTIHRLGLITLSESPGPDEFVHGIRAWLGGIAKRPLSASQLSNLWLLLNYGSLRQLLETHVAYDIVKTAVSTGKRKSTRNSDIQSPDALSVLTRASPARQVLAPLVAQFDANRRDTNALEQNLVQYVAAIDELTRDLEESKATMTELREELAAVKRQKEQDEVRIADLEKQFLDFQDGYQHKLDALRARIRGVLEGQLTRWLQTALEASRSDPPFMQAIDERLEDALKLIQKEVEWLQPLV